MATQPAHVLAARLALIDRLRAAEHRLARSAHAAAATAILRGHMHALGNAIQIIDLSSAELQRRYAVDPDEIVKDIRTASNEARATLAAMIALAYPDKRKKSEAAFASTIRNAVELVRPALGVKIDVRDELLASTATSKLDAEELETMVIAMLLDAHEATTLELILRERTIDNAPWLELIRCTDREGELGHEPPSLLGVVDQLVRAVGGELSHSAERAGHELVVALPQSSSSS